MSEVFCKKRVKRFMSEEVRPRPGHVRPRPGHFSGTRLKAVDWLESILNVNSNVGEIYFCVAIHQPPSKADVY